MPAISARRLVNAVINAIDESGYFGSLLSPLQQHPRKFFVDSQSGKGVHLWVYAWTLTHGGRPNLPDEYRIQMTTVQSPLELNPNGATVLMGYAPDLGVFAGFDIARHKEFTSGSPSVQIDISKVKLAQQFGMAFDRKSNDEIAIGVRPDQFVNYALNATELHALGTFPDTFQLLTDACELRDISNDALAVLPEPRSRIVRTVTQLARDASFRVQVVNAYGSRCAVTRAQLRLVDAAHILPVGANGPDLVKNGLALSPTMHRAYDQGLIFLDSQLEMQINQKRAAELSQLNLGDGLAQIEVHMGPILLPQDRNQWPSDDLIREANKLRGVTN